MTGPDHYRMAEEHLKHSTDTPSDDPEGAAWHQRQALVHATLALTLAATGVGADDTAAWAAVSR